MPARQASQEETAARLWFQAAGARTPRSAVRASPISASVTPPGSRLRPPTAAVAWSTAEA
ncbi:hypothetical protein [Actinocorallia libanotica]|uniref:hypothetical protein n=1 Tax=Actinocorallia libanotica TaxID=46162 RepID=UPI0031D0A348